MKAETELLKEIRTRKKELNLLSRRQDIIMKALIPEVKPTKEELRIMKSKKKFLSEREWRKALR